MRRVLGGAVVVSALALLGAFVATPLALGPQLVLGLSMVALALLVRRRAAPWVQAVLAVASVAVSARYLWFRVTRTLEFDGPASTCLGLLLLGAELYAFVVLVLGQLQIVEPLQRRPVRLPLDRATWPRVDVFIPTYNEPLEVVRPTVLAALALDWPADRFAVYLLDDGRRPAFRRFAAEVGATYLARSDNRHAKAGNLNHALARTHGELVAIFDCDHVATRSFLQLTTGWFLRDERLAMVQTPHHFYNPDPVERNLGQFRVVPNEGELFYGLVQAGNDFWNACFFCGSCALLRRTALESVGGIQTGSITEDALTALRLQRQGWNTAYLGVRQAAGLATDTLAAHVTQRIRWAQGMVQIFRLDNPLLGRGLRLGQRLCYLNATLHFLYAAPRLAFLLLPLAYLLFGLHICHTSAGLLLAYVLPHLALARIVATARTGRYRYVFWDAVYETVLSFYILLPTLTALLNPRAGSFKVTAKGERVETGGLDRHLARPYLVALLLLLAGVGAGVARLVVADSWDAGTAALNLAWAFGGVVLTAAAVAVAWERPQRRRAHRVPLVMPAMVVLGSGHARTARTIDLSLGGCALRLDEAEASDGAGALAPRSLEGQRVTVSLFADDRERSLPARVVGGPAPRLRLCFDALSLDDEAGLVDVLFGRPDAWIEWEAGRPPDRAVRGVATLVREGARAVMRIAAEVRS